MSLFHDDGRAPDSIDGTIVRYSWDASADVVVNAHRVTRCAAATTVDGDIGLEFGNEHGSSVVLLSPELAVALAQLLVTRLMGDDK